MNPAVTQRGEQPTNTSDVERHGHTVRSSPSVPVGTLGYVEWWGSDPGRMGHMSEMGANGTDVDENAHHVVVVGPDGQPLGAARIPSEGDRVQGEQLGD